GFSVSDINTLKLGVIRSIFPSCTAAILPGFGLGRVRPRFRTGFAWRGYGPRAPQSLPGIGIVSLDKAAGRTVTAGHSRHQYAVGDERRDNPLVAFLEFGELLSPDLLAGFHVERNNMRVQRLPKELSLVDGRRSAHDRTGGRNPQRRSIVIHGRAPDLPAGRDINRERPVAVHHVHHTVVNRWLRQFA